MPITSFLDWSADAWVALATAATALAAIVAALITQHRTRSRVAIVDVALVDRQEVIAGVVVTLPVVDVTVKNAGGKTAVITRAEVEVAQSWHLALQFPLLQAMPPSAHYQLTIEPTRAPPYTVQTAVSHAIKPDEPDRFTLTLAPAPMTPFESLYHLTLTLIYDGRRRTPPVSLIVAMPDMSASQPEYFRRQFYEKWARHQAHVWQSEHWKRVVDACFDEQRANEIDRLNRRYLGEVAAIEGTLNRRAAELIRAADTAG